jgi:hypothetical protein
MISCSMSHRTALLPPPSSVQTTRLPNKEPQAGKGTETLGNCQNNLGGRSVLSTECVCSWRHLGPIEATVCCSRDVHTMRFCRIAAIFGCEKPHRASGVVDVDPRLSTLNTVGSSKSAKSVIIVGIIQQAAMTVTVENL